MHGETDRITGNIKLITGSTPHARGNRGIW